MAFLGKLGKILGAAGAVAGAPFTGGASLAALGPILSAGGQIAGGIAGERAAGKQQEIGNQQNQNELQQRLYQAVLQAQQNQARIGADRAQFERDSPTIRAQQSMLGNAIANTQDVGMSGGSPRLQRSMVNFTGGLRPSVLGNRAAGHALEGIGTGNIGKDTFEVPNLPPPPQTSPLPDANWLDKLLGIAGPAASTLGALAPLMQRRQPQIPEQPPIQSPGLYSGLFL